MKIGKIRVSLAKRPQRTGTRGSRPSDRDRKALDEGYDDLILCVDLGSSGQDVSSRGVAALRRRGSVPRRGIAGVGQSGAPGVKSTSARVEEVL